jgi:hypothetical protein
LYIFYARNGKEDKCTCSWTGAEVGLSVDFFCSSICIYKIKKQYTKFNLHMHI